MDNVLLGSAGLVGSPPLATATVVVLMALAVRKDFIESRIPNTLNLAGLILGLGMMFLSGGTRGLVFSAVGALVGGAALFPLYFFHGTGAGDVKLMGVGGAFLGPVGALLAAVLTLVTGGVLAVAVVLWRLIEPRPSWQEVSSAGELPAVTRAMATISAARKERFPYAVAIATGVVTTLWLGGSLGALFAALGL